MADLPSALAAVSCLISSSFFASSKSSYHLMAVLNPSEVV
jgi:hypothetical protein